MIQGSFYVFYEVFTASFVINLIYFSGLPKQFQIVFQVFMILAGKFRVFPKISATSSLARRII